VNLRPSSKNRRFTKTLIAGALSILLQVFAGILMLVLMIFVGAMLGKDGNGLSWFGEVVVGGFIFVIIIYLAATGELFTDYRSPGDLAMERECADPAYQQREFEKMVEEVEGNLKEAIHSDVFISAQKPEQAEAEERRIFHETLLNAYSLCPQTDARAKDIINEAFVRYDRTGYNRELERDLN
jgi:hypothetical protein